METLIKLEDIKKYVKEYNQKYEGIKPIEIDKIVGTVGRYPNFYNYFNIKKIEETPRYQSLKNYYETYQNFPPIKVYQVGDKYFIIDGHHRVLFLKNETEVKYIDAEVTKIELVVDINDPNKEVKISDEGAKQILLNLERESFEKTTGLFSEILKYPIILTELSGYNKLYSEMKNYHNELIIKQENYSNDEHYSFLLWYKDQFLPAIEIIKKEKILQYFPNRTEADLYVWINLHKYYLSEKAGTNIDFNKSKEDFVEKFGDNKNFFKTFFKLFKK